MYITGVCFPCCDVKLFFCMTKKSRQKSKSLEGKELLRRNNNYLSSFLKGLLVAKTAKHCFRPESAPLKFIKRLLVSVFVLVNEIVLNGLDVIMIK